MNVLIVAIYVTLLTTVNAENNINLETILNILKGKPRKSGLINSEDTSDLDDVIPIIPGFYLEKPKDLSKSEFKNPTAWPDDIYAILSKEEEEDNKANANVDPNIESSEDDYLQRKILKAVEDLKKIQAGEQANPTKERLKKSNTYVDDEGDDDLVQKSDTQFKAHIHSEINQKEPTKKLSGRGFQGFNHGVDFKGRQKNKKSKNETNSSSNKILGDILKKILSGTFNNQPNPESIQYAYRYAKTEEETPKSKEILLGNILDDVQNNDLGPETEPDLRPTMVIISPKSFDIGDTEEENNAKEETSDEGISSESLRNTRRNDDDIGSSKKTSSIESTSLSGSSDYERNPGNPYTVHKNKYKQNWPYNHQMDGDHLNINPAGPKFGSLGPSGPELFFGRKWWYFNQDDFKPMG